MSGDEVFAMIVSAFFAIYCWKEFLGGLLFLGMLSRRPAARTVAWLALPFAACAILFVLLRWSSHDVRDNPVYIFFYMVLWLGWTGLWNLALDYLGLSWRDDAFECGNAAASIALGGGLLGVTLIFAGANIGEGPGWWVVVFCAAIGTATVLALWGIGNGFTRIQEAITVDRDAAAGWRTAGFFAGSGLILGRAVAGDWHSAQETLADFVVKGWPVLLLWGIVLMLDSACRPLPERPFPNRVLYGLLPGLLLIAAGIADVATQGPW